MLSPKLMRPKTPKENSKKRLASVCSPMPAIVMTAYNYKEIGSVLAGIKLGDLNGPWPPQIAWVSLVWCRMREMSLRHNERQGSCILYAQCMSSGKGQIDARYEPVKRVSFGGIYSNGSKHPLAHAQPALAIATH